MFLTKNNNNNNNNNNDNNNNQILHSPPLNVYLIAIHISSIFLKTLTSPFAKHKT